MKEISLKAAGMPLTSGMKAVLSHFFVKFAVSIAVIGAVITFLGLFLESDPVMFAGAFLAMAAIYPQTVSKEGGDDE